MALSRIWAAFIIVAMLAAGFQFFFIKGNKDIYSRMVVGKSGDTSQTRLVDSAVLSSVALQAIRKNKIYRDGIDIYTQNAQGAYITYK